ncbi:MAG: hypothetical protein JST16_03585 [Bdellovibrionales bacterium]|nr:hypothetical protein [Bdellovibrionales bacterium]
MNTSERAVFEKMVGLLETVLGTIEPSNQVMQMWLVKVQETVNEAKAVLKKSQKS